jgi:hypothetical protein
MPLRDDSFTQHQLQRWMRPDAHHFVRADWRRHVRPGHERDLPFALYERKYSADQPRVPSGSLAGGQWTSDGGASSVADGSNDSHVMSDAMSGNFYKPGQQFAARISPQRRAECEEQYRKDTFICNLIRTESCWSQASFRLAQCLIGGYVPPLYH